MRLNSTERALWLSVSLTLLICLPYDQLKGYSIFWISCLLAIPIYHYRINYRLFARRAIISIGCTEDGKAKRWLWHGAILKISNSIASVAISFLIIISATLLTFYEWLIVLSATVLLILLERATKNFAEREAVARFLPIFHRESVKFPVFAWIVIASSVLYFLGDQENLTNQDTLLLATARFNESFSSFDSQILGFSLGLLSAIDATTLSLAQQYIPSIEQTWARSFSWLYLSIKSGLAVGLVVYLLLGILTVVTEKERQGWAVLGRTAFDKYFTFTLIVLFILSISISNISTKPLLIVPITSTIDCSAITEGIVRATENRTRDLEEEEARLQTDMATRIDNSLEVIFSNVEPGIERYLDWHFSVTGQYEQLGAKVFSSYLPNAQQKIDEFIKNGLDIQLAQVTQGISSSISDEVNASRDTTRNQLSSLPQSSECSIASAPPSNSSISLLQPIGIGQPQFAVTTTALAAKVIAKKATLKVAAKTATKIGSKVITGLGSGVVLGSMCGPLVVVCGPVAAIGAWFAVDKIIVEVEEASERPGLRETMLSDLEEQKEVLRTQLSTYYVDTISAEYGEITSEFNVLRDGILNPN